MNDKDLSKKYKTGFYASLTDGSVRSASIILSRLFDIYKPQSVADFGCGHGAWLQAAGQLGCKQLQGFDGTWVKPDNILNPGIRFTPINMEDRITLEYKYDLAISVEVAEHLSESRARTFVEDICKASDIVIFSAAIPEQGGTNHINEQWQSYWVNLFKEKDYSCFDIFRPAIWHNPDVEWWYRQNTLLYVNNKTPDNLISKSQLLQLQSPVFDLVHPLHYKKKTSYKVSLRNIKRHLLRKFGIRKHKSISF